MLHEIGNGDEGNDEECPSDQKCLRVLSSSFSYCVPKDFCNKSEDCKGDYEVCVHVGGRYEGKCVGLRNRRDKINCDL